MVRSHTSSGYDAHVFALPSACLSVLGCIIIFTTYLVYKDIRSWSRHIIVCVTLSDFFTVISNGVGVFARHTSTDLCTVISFVGTSAVLSSFFWTMMLAVFLYITLVKEEQERAEKLVWPCFHIICWTIPVAINVIALISGKLGNNNDTDTAGWCWIKDDDKKGDKKELVLWMLFDGKLIEILAYVIVLVLYLLITVRLRKKIQTFSQIKGAASYISQQKLEVAKHAEKRLISIPVVFIILRIWGTIRFFIYAFNVKMESSTEYALLILHAIGDNSQATVNCVLYCLFTPKVRKHIKQPISCHRVTTDEHFEYVSGLDNQSSLTEYND